MRAVCLVLAFALAVTALPGQVHIAYGGDPATEMAVSWHTLGNVPSSVKYGTSSSDLSQSVTGVTHTYNASAGYFHDAVITGLSAGQKYFYVCGSSQDGWSPVRSFRTSMATFSAEVNIAVYGDFGVNNSEHVLPDLKSLAASGGIDFVFHVGDIGYADDYPAERYDHIYDEFMDNIEPISSVVPYMVLPGNHEWNGGYDNVKRPFVVYNQRFRMPWAESKGGNNMWYSWTHQNLVHFIAMDTETDYLNAPEIEHIFGDQIAWLEADLKAAKSSGVKWIVVGGHRPIYSSAVNYSREGVPVGPCLHLQTAVESLFMQYGVDLFLVGHQHAYERMYPTFKNKVVSTSYSNAQAPVNIIIGSAGCEEGIAARWVPNRPSWLAYRYPEVRQPGRDFGYGILRIKNENTLVWEFYTQTNHVNDTITLTK